MSGNADRWKIYSESSNNNSTTQSITFASYCNRDARDVSKEEKMIVWD